MEHKDVVEAREEDANESEQRSMFSRRDFLHGLRKWSAAVIGVAVAGAVFLPGETTSGWINGRGGGGWINGGGGGGGSWVNRSGGGGWINGRGGGGSWINR